MSQVKATANFNPDTLAKGDVLRANLTQEDYIFLRKHGSGFVLRHRKTGRCVSESRNNIKRSFKKIYAWTEWRKDNGLLNAQYRTNRKDIQYKVNDIQVEVHCHNDDIFNLEEGLKLARAKCESKTENAINLQMFNNKDIRGEIFGDYEVVEEHGKDSAGYIIWKLMDTESGKEIFYTRSKLKEMVADKSSILYNKPKKTPVYLKNANEDMEENSNVSYIEYEGDIFEAPFYYDVAFSIATDFIPHSGLTKALFERVPFLRDIEKKAKESGCKFETGVAGINKNVIALFLNEPHQKPKMDVLKLAIQDLASYCNAYNIEYLAMPKIGCGRGNLNWSEVKEEIINIFNDTYNNSDKKITIRFYI